MALSGRDLPPAPGISGTTTSPVTCLEYFLVERAHANPSTTYDEFRLPNRQFAEHYRVLKTTRNDGTKVDLDACAVPNWQPYKDCTSDMYG